MHIFNLNEQAHLIISSKDLLFRHHENDEQMQRHDFTEIKEISIIHRYDASHELYLFLAIHLHTQESAYLVQISSLNEPLEEVLSILEEELQGKVLLKLPDHKRLKTLRTHHKNYKLIALGCVGVLLGLLAYHKLNLPTFISLKENALQAKLIQNKGICSSRAKQAISTNKENELLLIHYCGILGTWHEESRRSFDKKHLQTEFSAKSYIEYIIASKQAFKDKKYSDVIMNTRKAIYLKPKDDRAYVLLSYAQFNQNEKEAAFENAKKALELAPNSKYAHDTIAFFYLDQDQLNEAYTHYMRSSEIEPNAKTYIQLASIDEKLGNKDKALEHIEKSMYLDTKDPNVLTQAGMLYWSTEKFDKAYDVLSKAYHLKPENSTYFLNYYEISLTKKQPIKTVQKDAFIQTYQNDKEKMIVFEMLSIIELSIANKPTEEAINSWNKEFYGQELNWSFKEIRSWLDSNDLELESKQNIQRTLGFFIGYQQAYKLEHQKIPTVKRQ